MKKVAFVLLLSLLCVMPVAMGQNIFMVTEQGPLEVEGAGNLGDYLRSQGYTVTVDAPDAQGTSDYQGMLTAEKISYLESFDVVLVHRSISSGSYNGAGIIDQWNQLQVPLFLGSAYLARNTRWLWIDSAQVRTVDLEVEILVPNHPVVKGLTGEIFTDPIGIDHVGKGNVGGGTIIAVMFGTGDPFIVAWEPDQPFYAAGGQIHTYPRLFLPLYRYHETTENAGGSYATDPADGDYSYYTENGLSMIKQGIDWLLSFGNSTAVENWEIFN